MINFFLGVTFGLVIGIVGGWYHRELWDQILNLKKPKEPEPISGVTNTETPVSKFRDSSESSFIAEPKTPQRIAWEERQAIEKEALSRGDIPR